MAHTRSRCHWSRNQANPWQAPAQTWRVLMLSCKTSAVHRGCRGPRPPFSKHTQRTGRTRFEPGTLHPDTWCSWRPAQPKKSPRFQNICANKTHSEGMKLSHLIHPWLGRALLALHPYVVPVSRDRSIHEKKLRGESLAQWFADEWLQKKSSPIFHGKLFHVFVPPTWFPLPACTVRVPCIVRRDVLFQRFKKHNTRTAQTKSLFILVHPSVIWATPATPSIPLFIFIFIYIYLFIYLFIY